MIKEKYEDVVKPSLLEGNVDHDAYTGFLEDYRVLHCLLRKYKPFSVFECGTNVGSGLNVIHAAVPKADLYSLDLDYESMCKDSAQYPLGENLEDRVGSAATVNYTQLRGDSKTFNYKGYACDAYFVDSEHNFETPFIETMEILTLEPKIIIYHDFDMPEVARGVMAAIRFHANSSKYDLYRVDGTRIAYLLRKEQIQAAA